MGEKEREIINEVLLQGSQTGRLFRVNAGRGWTGKVKKHTGSEMIIKNPRPFHGMPAGTPDIIGWEVKNLCEIIWKHIGKPCEIIKGIEEKINCSDCPVNKKIAVFKSIEVKTGKQKLSVKQENWKRQVIEAGGIYEERRG